MNRTTLAVLAGLLVGAGAASAQYPPGYSPHTPAGNNYLSAANGGIKAAGGQPPCPPAQGGPGNGRPGVLGPWYLYYPYEAHFITPAHPHFPYWPTPQTLYKGQTDAVPPVYAI